MHFFAQTVRNHFVDLVEKNRESQTESRKNIIMIPAMPEKTLLEISEAVTSFFLKEPDIHLTFKIAKVLTDTWTSLGRDKAELNGWLDERGNLTFYRSNVVVAPGKFSLIVLCGADRVTDAASLADFYSCDPQMIWETKMKGSFKKWITPKLQSIGIQEIDNKDIQNFDRVLIPLLKSGRGDILQISDWLDNIDLNPATDISHALKIILSSFDYFDLPLFTSFPINLKSRQLTPYINRATEFFNYTLFLEFKQRQKAVKTIDAVLDALKNGEDTGIPLDDEMVIGPYPSGEDFLTGLKKFIEVDDQNERLKLANCDFIIISDQILKFKRQSSETKEKNRGRKKLAGSPIDVFLTAIWSTLKDFYNDKNFDAYIKIEQIQIETDQFKHDIESTGDDGSESAEDKTDIAREYLIRLIGGIDEIIPKHLTLAYEDDSKISIYSRLTSSDVNCSYNKTAEPALEFSISIQKAGDNNKRFKREFAWRLPEHNVYRLSAELILRVNRAMESDKSIYKLPVFHIAYYDELLRASSDEEIRRVLLFCIRDERNLKDVFTNLLSDQWMGVDDPILPKLKDLAKKYENFIQAAAGQGLFSAIFPTESNWSDLRRAYADLFEDISENPNFLQSSLIGMLVRSFLVIQTKSGGYGDTWHADIFEKSGIATVLHPAVIEMLEAQVVYQTRCFNYAVNKELKTTSPKEAFKAYIWRTFMDLSTIQSPLTGLLYNEAGNLDTNVRGRELIHRIGLPESSDAPLSTRILIPYQESLDDNGVLNDSEIFQESSESRLLLRLMQDYFDLHPHARDGLSLAVFRNKDIQPVIAAVHAYLKILSTPPTSVRANKRYVLDTYRHRPYAISVTIFTESNDETDVAGWIDQWKERWEAAETEKKYQLYRQCRFSIAHRVVEKNGVGSLQKLVNDQFETDITVLYNFIGAGSGVDMFENVEEFDVTSRDLKFPILEKACCMIDDPGKAFKRSRVISNRQFVLGAHHANLLHGLSSKSSQQGTLVIGTGDFTPWRPVIDALHKKSEWVICIDPNMDERLIKRPVSESSKEREIIGFGSGVGTHGGDNYTISTEQFSLADIGSRLSASIQSLYAAKAEWSPEDCDKVTQGILTIAKDLSGLSLVRATGAADHYIRDFLAYSLSRKLLRAENSVLCESLISIDAYRHWFDLAENSQRPDLMWMQATIGDDKRFHLNMHLIECKMGNESSSHISKAVSQIENGLRVLVSAFMPMSNDGSGELEDDRPDRRYWWMQLHRLIACRGQIRKPQHAMVLTALERLAEGDYDIVWNASVFTFWINRDPSITRKGYWETEEDIVANIYAIGGGFVYQMATDPSEMKIDWAAMEKQGELLKNSESQIDGIDDDGSFWDMEDLYEEEPDDDILELQPKEDDPQQQFNLTEEESFSQTIDEDPEEDKDNEIHPDVADVTVPLPDVPAKTWDRVLLGKTITGNLPIYWEFGHRELANRHMLIFGSSGQGKTYAIQCMLCEMVKFRQKSLIIDYTNGFLPNHLESVTNEIMNPEQHVVSNKPLPINPFLPQSSDNGGILIEESANNVAKRIAGLFNSVYNIGDQQYSVLHRAIMEGVETLKEQMNLDQMLSIIEDMANDKKFKATAQTLHNKLRPFVLDEPFSYGKEGFDWISIFNNQDPLCNIFQLVGMDDYSKKLITEFILWDLYGFLQSKGKKTDPKVIVLDEVQNLDHQESSPLSKYLREGRKFGLSLILATQTMSQMKKDEQDRMFLAAHKLFFRPADTELKTFANIAALFTGQSQSEWVNKLSTLKKGECFSIGQALNEKNDLLVQRVFKIKISALEDRGLNA